MSSFPTALLLALLAAGAAAAAAKTVPDVAFFRECPPSRCSPWGPEVRYPLRLNASPPLCGYPGLELHCSGNDTILDHPSSAGHKVTGINYASGEITVDPGESWSRCSSGRLPLFNFTGSPFSADDCHMFTVVNCSGEVVMDGDDRGDFRGPIRCLSGAAHFFYAVRPLMDMDRLPAACDVVSAGALHPDLLPPPVRYDLCPREFRLWWLGSRGLSTCSSCEINGGFCGFRSRENETICYTLPSRGPRGKPRSVLRFLRKPPVPLIAGGACVGVVLIAAALLSLYVTRRSSRRNQARLKVEKFLATYRNTKPARYTYGDIKKMTKRFRHKLGRGGFGSVYRGELPNGIPVAVKMLETSMGDGEEFINEVATAGRIHHVNVVRLLGFCSEGPRRALVYEFMPNESLEKFIFSKDGRRRTDHRALTLEKLEEIAVGIARGIEYLHQGCDERILHFDIKPHNILLDRNFNPKISDFGLAKLCSKDQSAVSMTAARGTMGYIAPEVYSRNFGTVSYKSDVYSFGMLLMEMISGVKAAEPSIIVDNGDSQVYLPEQIYDRLVRNEELATGTGMEGREDVARKLAIVALWCIQWNPSDRPSMNRVVQMLTGSSEGLQIPTTPFVSFSGR